MSTLLKQLESGKILIGDGAMGTMLQDLGLQAGKCPESWNIAHPDKVRSIIADYISAGSDIVGTNSFGGTSYKLKHYYKDAGPEELAEIVSQHNSQAAQISRQAAGSDHFVIGSVGPTGQMMAPLGTDTEDDFYLAFKQQIIALAQGGADAICIETFSALEEATVALRAVKENTDLPAIITFTFEKNTRGEYRTMMGIGPEQMAQHFTDAGADIIGSNCGNGIEGLIDICKIIADNTDRYIMIQPNAGLPVLEGSKTVFKETPQEMARLAPQLAQAGANIIGGCCGTTPTHITAIKKALGL